MKQKYIEMETIARYTTAEADKKINEILGNMSTKNNIMPLSDIERIIEKKECYITGLTDLNFANELSNELTSITSIDLNLELKKYM